MSENNALSPRIRQLQSDLEVGHPTALATFWEEVEGHGAPLFETIEEDSQNINVTFLGRGDGNTEHVTFNSVINGFPEDPKANLMTRLLESDLWYLTKQVARDLLTFYYFLPNDPLIPRAELGKID